ncbi:radical SAM/SPASM domain-containing protein [Maridesulfovibrio frigidus]|uniref:radical SAM/SPASM domain-containing protein n=1 Tax=Maridesulfovibrio frigidus TaxID=340956 RepID=UPI0004E1469B|nr:radical SAM protein [Maridesulfovibrio frigidus]
MNTQKAILKKNWTLRGWTDLPHALVNIKDGMVLQLNPKEYHVASACNGKTNFNSFAFHGQHISILKQFINNNIARYCSSDANILDYQRYKIASTFRVHGLLWSITGRCNLNCKHCYLGHKFRKIELNTKEILNIISQLKESNINSVSLTGGEPFLRKDLHKIISFLLNANFRIPLIMTNGLLVGEHDLHYFKEINLNTDFQISFDGFGFHNEMRRSLDAEDLVVEKIVLLKRHEYSVIISSCLTNFNKRSIEKTYSFLKNIGIKTWRVSVPQNTGNWLKYTNHISFKEARDIYNYIFELWLLDNKPFNLKLGPFFNSEASMRYKRNELSTKYDIYSCNALRFTPYLLPDGTLLPCTGFTGSRLQGDMLNVLTDSFKYAWEHPFMRKIVSIKVKDLFISNPECEKCAHLEKCSLGCRANALTEEGLLFGKDPICCDAWKSGLADSLYQQCT